MPRFRSCCVRRCDTAPPNVAALLGMLHPEIFSQIEVGVCFQPLWLGGCIKWRDLAHKSAECCGKQQEG